MPFTYAGQYSDEFMDKHGNALGSLSVKVLTGLVGSALATLYTARDKLTTAANPATTDANGNLSIFAEPGQYRLVAVVAGVDKPAIAITIAADPEEDSAGTVAAEDVTYDPTVSGLTATDIKAAIDELVQDFGEVPPADLLATLGASCRLVYLTTALSGVPSDGWYFPGEVAVDLTGRVCSVTWEGTAAQIPAQGTGDTAFRVGDTALVRATSL